MKITFAKRASLKDPDGLFTQDGKVRLAIDFHEDDIIREEQHKALKRADVSLNMSK